jgi:hypothetical protein
VEQRALKINTLDNHSTYGATLTHGEGCIRLGIVSSDHGGIVFKQLPAGRKICFQLLGAELFHDAAQKY